MYYIHQDGMFLVSRQHPVAVAFAQCVFLQVSPLPLNQTVSLHGTLSLPPFPVEMDTDEVLHAHSVVQAQHTCLRRGGGCTVHSQCPTARFGTHIGRWQGRGGGGERMQTHENTKPSPSGSARWPTNGVLVNDHSGWHSGQLGSFGGLLLFLLPLLLLPSETVLPHAHCRPDHHNQP